MASRQGQAFPKAIASKRHRRRSDSRGRRLGRGSLRELISAGKRGSSMKEEPKYKKWAYCY